MLQGEEIAGDMPAAKESSDSADAEIIGWFAIP